jgi:hypothetical protein
MTSHPRIRAGRSSPGVPGRRGAAIVEVAFVAVALTFLLFAMIEFGRALLARHAITSLSREAANLIARGTTLPATLQAMLATSDSTDLVQDGYVILTTVTRDSNNILLITEQVSGGGQPAASRIGTASSSGVNLPGGPQGGVPLQGQTLYIAEIFIDFAPVTPIATILDLVMPSTLYDVACF